MLPSGKRKPAIPPKGENEGHEKRYKKFGPQGSMTGGKVFREHAIRLKKMQIVMSERFAAHQEVHGSRTDNGRRCTQERD